jgi:hypothetical protein
MLDLRVEINPKTGPWFGGDAIEFHRHLEPMGGFELPSCCSRIGQPVPTPRNSIASVAIAFHQGLNDAIFGHAGYH